MSKHTDHETSYYQRNGVNTIPGGRMDKYAELAKPLTADIYRLTEERDRLQEQLKRERAINAELVDVLDDMLAADAARLAKLEKKTYAIGIGTVRSRVARARSILARARGES